MDVIFNPAPPALSSRTAMPQQGHTLTELIATIAIAMLLMGIVVPSFAELIQNSRLTTAVNTLVSTLHYTRSEAIKRNQAAIICKGTPEDGCNTSQAWHDGWLVYVDDNGNRSWDEGESLLRVQAALESRQTLAWNAFPSSNYVIYYPNGRASSNGTFIFCDQRGATAAKALIIAKSGRVRLASKAANNTALECAP